MSFLGLGDDDDVDTTAPVSAPTPTRITVASSSASASTTAAPRRTTTSVDEEREETTVRRQTTTAARDIVAAESSSSSSSSYTGTAPGIVGPLGDGCGGQGATTESCMDAVGRLTPMEQGIVALSVIVPVLVIALILVWWRRKHKLKMKKAEAANKA